MGGERIYRTKPVVVEAMQVTDQNIKEVAKWCGGHIATRYNFPVITPHYAKAGDWIIKEHGDFRRCKPDVFERLYELDIASDSRQAV